jgi:hypothetical protein
MGNNQSNLSDGEKKVLVGVSIGAAIGASILTAGLAAPIAAKGVETVINYTSSQGESGGGSSSSNVHMASGSVSSGTTGVSKTSSPV